MVPTVATSKPGSRRRFSAAEMLRMMASGIFGEEDRVELVQGEVLTVTPRGPDHRGLKDELHARLALAYAGQDVHVLDQGPVQTGPRGVPEPDLAIVRGPARDYLERHPRGEELLLVVELAKTSQQRDRDKAQDYAMGSVSEYWILDLVARTLEVHTDPDPELGNYRSVVLLDDTQSVGVPNTQAQWRVASLLA